MPRIIQLGDRVWDIDDDPDKPDTWGKVIEVLDTTEAEMYPDQPMFQVRLEGMDPEDNLWVKWDDGHWEVT